MSSTTTKIALLALLPFTLGSAVPNELLAASSPPPPNPNPGWQCETSASSPSIDNLNGGIAYLRGVTGELCTNINGAGGCTQMYRADGIRLYICGEGHPAPCPDAADAVQWLVDHCGEVVDGQGKAGGQAYLGDNTFYVTLSQ